VFGLGFIQKTPLLDLHSCCSLKLTNKQILSWCSSLYVLLFDLICLTHCCFQLGEFAEAAMWAIWMQQWVRVYVRVNVCVYVIVYARMCVLCLFECCLEFFWVPVLVSCPFYYMLNCWGLARATGQAAFLASHPNPIPSSMLDASI